MAGEPRVRTTSGAAGSLPEGLHLDTWHIDTFGQPPQSIWHVRATIPDGSDEGQLIGRLDFSEFEDQYRIDMIAVHPDFRRRGVAMAMIHELMKKAPWEEIKKTYQSEAGARLVEAVERDRGNRPEPSTTGGAPFESMRTELEQGHRHVVATVEDLYQNCTIPLGDEEGLPEYLLSLHRAFTGWNPYDRPDNDYYSLDAYAQTPPWGGWLAARTKSLNGSAAFLAGYIACLLAMPVIYVRKGYSDVLETQHPGTEDRLRLLLEELYQVAASGKPPPDIGWLRNLIPQDWRAEYTAATTSLLVAINTLVTLTSRLRGHTALGDAVGVPDLLYSVVARCLKALRDDAMRRAPKFPSALMTVQSEQQDEQEVSSRFLRCWWSNVSRRLAVRGGPSEVSGPPGTTGVLLPCKKKDIIDERTWCIYKHDPADHSKAAAFQPKGWPRHFISEEAGKRGLAAMHAHAGSPPIDMYRIFVAPVSLSWVHRLSKQMTQNASIKEREAWKKEGEKGVVLLAMLPADLESLRVWVASVRDHPPQIGMMQSRGRTVVAKGDLQMRWDPPWPADPPRAVWIPGNLIDTLVREGWPDLRMLKEIPADRLPLVQEHITRRADLPKWPRPIHLEGRTYINVHYVQAGKRGILKKLELPGMLAVAETGWSWMFLRAELSLDAVMRPDDDPLSKSVSGSPDWTPPDEPRVKMPGDASRRVPTARLPITRVRISNPEDWSRDCRVSDEDAALINRLAGLRPRGPEHIAFLSRLSPQVQVEAVRLAIELGLRAVPPDAHLLRFWKMVTDDQAHSIPGAERALIESTQFLTHERPGLLPSQQARWALGPGWAFQLLQGIHQWAEVEDHLRFGTVLNPFAPTGLTRNLPQPIVTNNLMHAFERVQVAYGLYRESEGEVREHPLELPAPYTVRFLTCWWAAVQRRWPIRDVKTATLAGPPEVPPNPFPEGSDARILFNELIEQAQRHPGRMGNEPALVHRSLILLRRAGEGTHHAAWPEVVRYMVDAGLIHAAETQPFGPDVYDKRYTMPDCPKVVWDSAEGLGAVGNNQDIRYFGFLALMDPAVFLQLAAPLDGVERGPSISALEKYRLMPGWGPPILYLDVEDPELIHVIGHEGRHRSTVYQKLCPGALMPVAFMPQYLRARNVTEDLLRNIRLGIRSERSEREFDNSRFISGPLFDTVYLEGRKISLAKPRTVAGPEPVPETLIEQTLADIIREWNLGSTTIDMAHARFDLLARRIPDPGSVAAVLGRLRSRSPKLVDAFMRRLPADAQLASIEVSPEGVVSVETTAQIEEDDPLLPVIRGFDEAMLPHEAMLFAHEYFDGLWRAGLSPAKLGSLIDRLEPMVLGPDAWSGADVVRHLRSSLGNRLKKPWTPGSTVQGLRPPHAPLTPKQLETIQKNEGTPEGRKFLKEMQDLLGKTPEEARRALLRPSAWREVLRQAREGASRRRKAAGHSAELEDAIWIRVPSIQLKPGTSLEKAESAAIRELTRRHAERTGRNKRAPHEVVQRINREETASQTVFVRILKDYFQLVIPFGVDPVDASRRVEVYERSEGPRPTGPRADPEADASLVDPVVKFFESGLRNTWLKIDRELEVYVRRGTRIYGRDAHRTLDLANFRISNPQELRKGRFSRFMRALMADPRLAGWSLYVENVLGGSDDESWKLVDWFRDRSSVWAESGTWPPSFWVLRPDSKGEDPPYAKGL